MLSRFTKFTVAAFAAGTWALLGLSCAVVESTSPKAAAPPQHGAATGLPTQGNEVDALRKQLTQHWKPPAGAKNPQELVVQIRISLKPDGTLASPPRVLTDGTSELYRASRDSALRAVYRSQPFSMLSPATYNFWKEIEITFDPRDMGRR